MFKYPINTLFKNSSLSALGGEVTQITTNKLIRQRKQANVKISPPAIGELELGFSSVLGNFDALVDTLSDEAKQGDAVCRGLDLDYSNGNQGKGCSSAVISMLQKQNKCKRYISTLNTSQKKVQDDGIIWGRSNAAGYGKDVIRRVTSSTTVESKHSLVPPKHFGTKTLQRLLDAGVIYKNKEKDVFMHRWNMADFLELVSWPREADGGNIRFGLPVVEDLDSLYDESEVEGRMVSAPPLSSYAVVPKAPEENGYVERKNPYILDINGLNDLNTEVLDPEKDCMLFLSAAYCRTCKYLAPQYLKLAREHVKAGDDVVFAKANAVGKLGKEIRRTLGVDAVPAFCFFKAGERYGSIISVSKMPSKKLDAALDLLISGEKWDGNAISRLS
jgi:thiol-disulfide isomerase/thioredoxin